jgi:hypothetical protein
MTFSTQPRPAWQTIENSLASVDLRSLEQAVADWLDEFMPRVIPRKKGRPELRDLAMYQRRLDLVVSRHLGLWYGWHGWRIANESFGGCFCHAFLSEFCAEPRQDGVQRAAVWVVAEVRTMLQCLRDFQFYFSLFQPSKDPGDCASAMSATMGHVFETVITATACNAQWGRFVTDGCLWMLDDCAVESSATLDSIFGEAIQGLCSEPLQPSPEARYRLCDDLAAVVVHCRPE